MYIGMQCNIDERYLPFHVESFLFDRKMDESFFIEIVWETYDAYIGHGCTEKRVWFVYIGMSLFLVCLPFICQMQWENKQANKWMIWKWKPLPCHIHWIEK